MAKTSMRRNRESLGRSVVVVGTRHVSRVLKGVSCVCSCRGGSSVGPGAGACQGGPRPPQSVWLEDTRYKCVQAGRGLDNLSG